MLAGHCGGYTARVGNSWAATPLNLQRSRSASVWPPCLTRCRPGPPASPRAGAFTNQIQKGFEEPRLLIVTDPRTDHQSIKEAAYMNIPVIAFCDTDSDLQVRPLCRRQGQGGAQRGLPGA